MSGRNDGGPAYPYNSLGPYGHSTGISKRDMIAIGALSGMLAHATRYRPRPGSPANWHDAISEEAYQLADAMLAARNKEST